MFKTLAPALALALAVLSAWWFDSELFRRRLVPPRFDEPWRRAAAGLMLAAMLFLGIFLPLLTLGESDPAEVTTQPAWALFTVHMLLALTVSGWYLAGFGVGLWADPGARRGFAAEFGLVTRQPLVDVGLGFLGGGLGWVGLIAVMVTVLGVVSALAGPEALPQHPPEVIAWIVGQPWWLRLALALSAGFFEEVFFRGFLQPRIGIAASSACFVIAHAGYEQPFMLVGLTFLSLLFAWMTRERQSIWPAVVAHAAFDAFQLLVVIPLALQLVPSAG